ncbi:MFS transporter [Streptomyces sp. NPDC012746]|uniref:MFS transporter n=1 Tax=Streptomyces sp. NPDC012746 TaxID=3364845 RepID=UPI0036ADCA19
MAHAYEAHTPGSPAPGAGGTGLGRRFGLFRIAVLASGLADGVYLVSVPLLALSLTGSPLAVAAVGVALRAPWLLMTLPAGVVVDRLPPLRLLRRASAARLPLVVALSVLAWCGLLPVWGLAAGAFLVGVCGTFVDLAAQSLVPHLADRAQLPRANARLQTGQLLTAQFAGPALGGLLATRPGIGMAVAAVLYVTTLAGLEVLRRRLPAPPSAGAPVPDRSMRRELREGAAHLRHRRDLLGLAAVAASGNLAFAAVTTMLPLWVVAPGRLGLPESAMGLVAAAPAVGGLLAGTAAAHLLRRFGARRVLMCCAPAAGLAHATIAVPSVVAALAAMACYGALSVQLNVTSMSYRQSSIPAPLFGRVNALYRWLILGVSPFGALLGGVAAERLGTGAVFLGAGALCLLTGTLLPALLFHPPAGTPGGVPAGVPRPVPTTHKESP